MKRTRNEYIMLTVTKEEKEQIKAQAFAADLPVTIYCRKVLLAARKRKEGEQLDRTV